MSCCGGGSNGYCNGVLGGFGTSGVYGGRSSYFGSGCCTRRPCDPCCGGNGNCGYGSEMRSVFDGRGPFGGRCFGGCLGPRSNGYGFSYGRPNGCCGSNCSNISSCFGGMMSGGNSGCGGRC